MTSEACSIEPPELSTALASMRGEVLASRALALTSMGRVADGRELATRASEGTSGIEAKGLALATRAVAALKARDPNAIPMCVALLRESFEMGAVDPAVTAYRANRELLGALVAAADAREQVVFLLRRAGDVDLLGEIGITTDDLIDPTVSLSVREREVHDLMCQGLSNRAIAKQLFISESTVKVHVHHVFDKLGIRSRTAVAINAAMRGQPTPADSNSNSAARSDSD